jgi:hypothetical protein
VRESLPSAELLGTGDTLSPLLLTIFSFEELIIRISKVLF